MRATKLKKPRKDAAQPRKVKKPAAHVRGTSGSYKPKPKKEVAPFRAPEPNFHGVYCEYMPSTQSVFFHGPIGEHGPRYLSAATPEALWDMLVNLASQPGALNPTARMPQATEALEWSDETMQRHIDDFCEKNQITKLSPGAGLRKRPVRKLSLEELGLA